MASLTVDNWLAIGAIGIAVLAPVGQVLFQRHLERSDRKQLGDANHGTRPQFMPAWKRRLIRALLYLVPGAALLVELFSSGELGRLGVLSISVCVASIFTMYLSHRLTGVMGRMLLLQEEHWYVTKSLAKLRGESNDATTTTDASTTKRPNRQRAKKR